MSAPRNIIELIDKSSGKAAIAHKFDGGVLIDGNPVSVELGSLHINYGEKELTTVTLTLQPKEIKFSHLHTRETSQ